MHSGAAVSHPARCTAPLHLRYSQLPEVQAAVLGPVDVADGASGQRGDGGEVVLREGQQQSQGPDHQDHHPGLCGAEPLLQGPDDRHVPERGEEGGYSQILKHKCSKTHEEEGVITEQIYK